MESLNSLANSLEPKEGHSLEQNEQLLTKDFRAAALSITTLYRSSLQASKRAYDSGYATCLADVLSFIQKGVSSSTGELSATEEEWQRDARTSMSVGRVMDWLEARLDAIGGKDEDDQEDEQMHRSAKLRSSAPPPPREESQDRRQKESTPPVRPASPSPHHGRSPTPPSANNARSQSPTSSPRTQPLPLPKRKLRARSKEIQSFGGILPLGFSSLTNAASTPFTFSVPMSDMSLVNSPLSAFVLPDAPTPTMGAGTKRRHSEVSHTPAATGGAVGSGSRSHKRRNKNQQQQSQQGDGMEVEEDSDTRGRERRKQARRERAGQ